MKRGLRLFATPCTYSIFVVRRPTPMKRGLRHGPAAAALQDVGDVRRPTPMKRGLRPPGPASPGRSSRVRRPTPMKRGLRLLAPEQAGGVPGGPETHPDEEGIETARVVADVAETLVRRPTPMKRGLRLGQLDLLVTDDLVRRPTPMKRGLRRRTFCITPPMLTGPETHPDEEGIETRRGRLSEIPTQVRRPTPMKRGLRRPMESLLASVIESGDPPR